MEEREVGSGLGFLFSHTHEKRRAPPIITRIMHPSTSGLTPGRHASTCCRARACVRQAARAPGRRVAATAASASAAALARPSTTSILLLPSSTTRSRGRKAGWGSLQTVAVFTGKRKRGRDTWRGESAAFLRAHLQKKKTPLSPTQASSKAWPPFQPSTGGRRARPPWASTSRPARSLALPSGPASPSTGRA